MSWTVCILEMVTVHPELMEVFGSVNRSRSTSLCVWGGVGIIFISLCAQLLSRVQLFGTPWPAAHQAPVPMEFSRKKYWSGLPYLLQGIFLTQESSPHLQSPHLLCLLHAGGFLTIEPPLLLLCSVMSDPLQSHRLQPAQLFWPWIFQARILEWVAISFFRGSSPPRDRTCISSIACVGKQILSPLRHLGSPIRLLFEVLRQKSNSTLLWIRNVRDMLCNLQQLTWAL